MSQFGAGFLDLNRSSSKFYVILLYSNCPLGIEPSMSYALSIHPAPPREPSAFWVVASQYLRIPSAWRWLSRMWGHNLLALKGFNGLIPEMTQDEAKKELPKWEASYKIIERYHRFLEEQHQQGNLSGKNFLPFFDIVKVTKEEVATIITSLMLASRSKNNANREAYLIDGLVQNGNKNLLALVLK
jgi:hypothetical protein